jgi:tetratricopeptide (TPR) repeat protein
MKTNCSKSLFVYFVSLSILFCALPGFAENGTIIVKCVDPSSNPVQGVNIVVSPLGNPKTKDKKSDSKGEAEFTKLDDGFYRVIGRKDGFEPACFEFVNLKGSIENITLKLAAGSDRKLYFEDPAQGQKAADLMKQALDLYGQKQFSDAEKLLSQAIELDPSNPEAFRYLGVTFIQQSKYDQGVEALNKAAKIAGVFAAVPQEQGKPSPAQCQQIIEYVQGVLKQLPVTKGMNSYKQQKFDVAIADFSEALKSDPNNTDAYYYLAASLASSQRYDEALTNIDKAIQLKPGVKEFEGLKSKIGELKKNGEIARANSVLKEGDALFDKDDAAGALKKYEEAKDMVAPSSQSVIWKRIGKAQAKLNQPEAAIQSFKKSIELAKNEKEALDNRKAFAQFYLDQQKYEEAVNVLTETKNGADQNIEQNLLSIFQDSKDAEPKLAQIIMERVIKINPQNADAYFELGKLYYIDGKEKDSRTKELFAKYLELGKDQDKIDSIKAFLVTINRRSK